MNWVDLRFVRNRFYCINWFSILKINTNSIQLFKCLYHSTVNSIYFLLTLKCLYCRATRNHAFGPYLLLKRLDLYQSSLQNPYQLRRRLFWLPSYFLILSIDQHSLYSRLHLLYSLHDFAALCDSWRV